jgi:Fe-S oxidoreductase
MSSLNFPAWKVNVAGRMKVKQILETFRDVMSPEIKKFVCAPCSNCKAQLRDLFDHYGLTDRYNIHYVGLAELIVNAMADLHEPFIT